MAARSCQRFGSFFLPWIVLFMLAIFATSMGQENGYVRIIDGNSTSGMVEVYLDDKWRMICADSWDIEDALVICRQLGFSEASVLVATEDDVVDNSTESLNNLGCLGNELLITDCPFDRSTGCSGSMYAYVNCLVPATLDDGEIRFTEGNETAGRVETFLDGRWLTVCDDFWDFNRALVVCQQRGFKGSYDTILGEMELRRTGVFVKLLCEGVEQTILDCDYSLVDECTYEDAVVSCITYDQGDVRIAGANSTSGLVEVYFEMRWIAVCSDGWDLTDADVLCRQLGLMEAVSTYEDTETESDMFSLSQVDCFGNEEKLLDCAYSTSQDCQTKSYARAVCKAPENGTVRLVGGSDMFSGRLEIFLKGEWGSVCDDDWHLTDANVVCRQLGYGKAIRHTVGSFPFGAGTGPILTCCLDCHGNETDLVSCARSADYICDHTEDAGVICEQSNFAKDFPVRLMGAIGTPYSGRVEVLVEGQWGTICDNEWDIRDANVVCRQLGFGIAVDANRQASFGQGTGPIVFTEMDCNGTEKNLWDCPLHLGIGSGDISCSHSDDAGVICSGACVVAECPPDVQTTLEPGSDTIGVSWVEPSSVNSPCGTVSFTSSHSPRDRFQEGDTIVSYRFEDASGAQDSCNFTVKVATRVTERGIHVVAVIIPACAFVALIIVILLLRRFKVPKRLWERSLPPLPKSRTPSKNPAYIHSEDSCSDIEYIAVEDNNDNVYAMVGASRKVENDIAANEKSQTTASKQGVNLPSFKDQDRDFKGNSDHSTGPSGNFYISDDGHFVQENDDCQKDTTYEAPLNDNVDAKTEPFYAHNIEGDVVQQEQPIYFEHDPNAGMDSQDSESDDVVFVSEDGRGQDNSQSTEGCNASEVQEVENGEKLKYDDKDISTRMVTDDDNDVKDSEIKSNKRDVPNTVFYDIGEF
ncbi:Deleted in malignant brain tumors 1 protein [Holothuria leucospilota]|uniref:Deleted in malignant brain tumors 1 protein n=1 Tax=Holothuria leucospilota TaxID=206669 RepID=A0A9Q0YSW5_HOLLE|nr:Deleted in malignant brain tumors 1 protein [Holothuria leucospilota]